MSSLTMLEKEILERILNMSRGEVLDFSIQKLNKFFLECGINIDDPKYGGESKAKRLREFWEQEPDAIVGKILKELLKWWDDKNDNPTENKKSDLLKAEKIISRLLEVEQQELIKEDKFLKKDFGEISLKKLPINLELLPILESRLKEVNQCLNNNAPLAAIFLIGSVLEGILLGMATKNQQIFNQAKAAPKNKEGKLRDFKDWKLGEFIDVAHAIGFLNLDIKKFSHVLRDFRNYIHPNEQMCSKFNPDIHTAQICLQVLKAAVVALSEERKIK